MPHSPEELEKRLIRDVERMESESSISTKVNLMRHDMQLVDGLSLINKRNSNKSAFATQT